MMRVFLLLLLVSSETFACELPPQTKLLIGCTYKCNFFYRWRLNFSAWALGYRIKVVDLREQGNFKEALEKVDGVLIPGGADIDPAYYSDRVTPELREYIEKNRHLVNLTPEGRVRDPYEYAFVREYMKNDDHQDLPLLGICRGMQMMTVAQGVPLYLDIKTELGIKNRKNLFDRISVEKGRALDQIYLNDSFKGYKLHHQGLRVPYYLEHALEYPDLKINAWSHKGQIAEGIEYTNRPAIGVQYHPEKSLTNTAAPIFRWFLTRSCENKNSKGSP